MDHALFCSTLVNFMAHLFASRCASMQSMEPLKRPFRITLHLVNQGNAGPPSRYYHGIRFRYFLVEELQRVEKRV